MPRSFISSAQQALPAKTPADLKEFTKSFYKQVPAEDQALLSPGQAAKIAQHHWATTKKRKRGELFIEITNPGKGKVSKNAAHTIINIVHDDMAFLIDTVVAEIVRQNHLIHYLIHPVMHVTRTQAGIFKKASAAPAKGTEGQSHIYIELRGTLTRAHAQELEIGLRQVLSDVDYATRDWHKMRAKLRDAQRELSKAPASHDDATIEEYQAFLEYLHDNNFTLLGFRAYKLVERNGKLSSQTIKGSSLGLLHDDVSPVYINEARKGLTQPQQKLRKKQKPLSISKVNKRSTVHRRVPLDAIAVKTFDNKGIVSGEMLFIGLFTSVTYSRSVGDIPYVRTKVQNILNSSGFLPASHDRKALRHILERYPRDEMLQIDEDLLFQYATSILRLQERPRIALYTRTDPFGRYISCLVYVPRERYDTRLRMKFQRILEEELNGICTSYNVTQDDSTLSRLIYLIDVNRLKTPPSFSADKVEDKLEETGSLWSERLYKTLGKRGYDEQRTSAITARYGNAFPVNYHDRYTLDQAVHDIEKLECLFMPGQAQQQVQGQEQGNKQAQKKGEAKAKAKVKVKTESGPGGAFELDLYRPKNCDPDKLRLKIYHKGAPITLSDVLPKMENMGMKVIAELPFEIQPVNGEHIWIHDFLMHMASSEDFPPIEEVKSLFEEAFKKIWHDELENDSLNRLVVNARTDWRDVTVLRAYIRYLRQIGFSYSRNYIEQALADHPDIAQYLLQLFHIRLAPKREGTRPEKEKSAAAKIDKALEKVQSLDQDRILQRIKSLIEATLRTNFYQTGENSAPYAHLSLKFESALVPGMPDPKPFREIFVYSPRVEGIHLRGDSIARGGLRWSDRHEDFRTEILGLMKAQMVKNAVIVPMGAKGGFVVKKPPQAGGRQAFLDEGIACYKTFIRGLLDITDNLKGEKIIPPKNVVRRDGDDPYLVVAADKGTATFSDIANALSEEYGFWMGDAFASGGSAGYDHKKMGITARGAWESVKRHFRELNHDTQTQPFDVVGIGDMGGDVFGNGMLLSEKIRLIGAFNHLHIFCDPDPDPAQSFKERKRLFKNVKGWDAYDQSKLSKGGRIFNRSDKSLSLTPEIKKRFDMNADKVTPNELLRAMLKSRTDLLWFGGIGTYIRAQKENNAEVGDKANDALRVTAKEVRAKVIGEGANLAVTLDARIEYAENGGKINADFIDNSAGVDSSDHEVNIKILLSDVMSNSRHKMDRISRNKLLESMTDNVAENVLRHNYQQAQGISLMEIQASENLSIHAAFITDLEREMGIIRALEGLPEQEDIDMRLQQGKGLNRPELSALQAYAKITFAQDLLKSDIPDSKQVQGWLCDYFPAPLCENYIKEIYNHRLSREIIATSMANGLVNRMGPTFVKEKMDLTGASNAEVAKAYIIVRDAFRLRPLWDELESLDGKVPAQVQINAMREIARMAGRSVSWLLTRLGRDLDINKDIRKYSDGIAKIKKNLDNVVTPLSRESILQLTHKGQSDGLPEKLAHDIAQMPVLSSACDIIRISAAQKTDLLLTACTYFELGEHFHLDWLRKKARFLRGEDRWASEALGGLIDHLYSCQAGITIRILKDMHKDIESGKIGKGKGRRNIVKKWIETHGHQATLLEPLFEDLRRAGSVDMAMLIIAEQRLRGLYGG